LELPTKTLIKRTIVSTVVTYFDNDHKPVYVTTNGAETPHHIQALLEVDCLFSLLDVSIGTAYYTVNENEIKPLLWTSIKKMLDLIERSDKITSLLAGKTEHHGNDLPIGIRYLTKRTDYNNPQIFIY
jgi:hypothetical protein